MLLDFVIKMLVFDLLHSRVADLAKNRFEKPTPIQEKAIPKILEGKSTLVISGTGSGKTEAVMLGLFSKLVSAEHKPIALLYITPLRSLNRDMFERLVWWCSKLDIDIAVRHGDTTQHERKLQAEHPPHILITTPEQLQGMLSGERMRKHVSNLKYVIVDELHELVESKRGMQLAIALERLKQRSGAFQIIALSATIGSPKIAAEFIGCSEIVKEDVLKDTEIKVLSPYPSLHDKALADKIFVGEEVAARLSEIYELMKMYRSVLTFTNTREAAEVLSSRLRTLDKEFPHDIHHSSLSKEVRIKAEKEFKEEKLKALIATSSLELGIDIGSIDLVIQYMSPRQVSKLTQRIGRSGHSLSKKSLGFIIAGDGDDIFESAVIAKKALRGELEGLRPQKDALDVLTNQIIGILMEKYECDAKEIFSTVKKSYPFSSLTEREFSNIIEFLSQLKLVWRNSSQIKRSRKALEYFFENLSMIPDSYQLKVIDASSNMFVGSVDEQFVATQNSDNFIVKGRPWKILSIENDKIYVEPSDNIESAIPAWEGELIPVPYAVAQGVLELRNSIAIMLTGGRKDSEIIEYLMHNYPVSQYAAKKMVSLIKKHIKTFPVPTDFLVERYEDFAIVHACFGTRVNETLARFVSTVLSAEYGAAVATRTDPYRIIFKAAKTEDIERVLRIYKPDEIEVLLAKSLPRTSLFKWKFIFVAKRFGAIAKRAKYDKISIEKIIDLYTLSPIYTETLRELFHEKLDIDKTKSIILQLQTGQMKFSVIEGLSPIAQEGFRHELHDVAKPSRPEADIFRLFKKRLLSTKLRLICINCGKYSVAHTADSLPDKPVCPQCGSRLLACMREYHTASHDIVKKWLAGKPLTTEETKLLNRVKWSAELMLDFGRKAAICLSGRGIGPDTAVRTLAKHSRTEDDLLKHILEAERTFLRTKKYWT